MLVMMVNGMGEEVAVNPREVQAVLPEEWCEFLPGKEVIRIPACGIHVAGRNVLIPKAVREVVRMLNEAEEREKGAAI